MAITSKAGFMNAPAGIDDVFPFSFMESREEIEKKQKKEFEELPDEYREKIRASYEGGLLDLESARALVRHPEKLLKECPEGNLWFYTNEMGHGNKSVICMSPVLFAFYTGEYKAADRLLSLKEFNDFDKYAPAEFMLVNQLPEDDTYSLLGRDRYERQEYYKFVLGNYIYGSCGEKTLPVILKFIKCHDKGAYDGWISTPGTEDYPVLTAGEEHVKLGADCFGFIPNNDLYDPFLKLLEYVSDNDKALFRHMVSKDTFVELLMYYCTSEIPFSKNSNLQAIKKIYRISGIDLTPCDLWIDIYLRVYNHEFCNFGYEERCDDIRKCFEKITGKVLVFNAFDAGFDPESTVIEVELLEALIRVSHHAIYSDGGEDAYRVSFCLDRLIEFGGEELIKTALKKDFITAADCDELLKKARSVNKCSLIPLLVLKKHGEWPAFEAGEGDRDGKKKV